MDYAGGWELTGTTGRNDSIDLDTRLQLVHNHMGVDALFQWGVVEHNGTRKVGIIAGGWEDSLLAPADGRDYLKLMSMYVLLLAQASEDDEEEAVEVTVDLDQDGDGHEGDEELGIELTDGDYNDLAYEYPELELLNGSSSISTVNGTKDGGMDLKGLLGILNPFNWAKRGADDERDDGDGELKIDEIRGGVAMEAEEDLDEAEVEVVAVIIEDNEDDGDNIVIKEEDQTEGSKR